MRDDRAMGEEDFAVLEDVVYELFGDAVDPRELSDVISKQNDMSENHVLTGAAKKKHTRKQLVNTVGQGLNALAIGAGTHAMVMAGRDERLNTAGKADAAAGKKTFARAASAPYRAWEKTGAHQWLDRKMGHKAGVNAKWAIPAAGGALALHSAEIVGDSIAANALHGQRKQNDMTSVVTQRAKAKEKVLVKKALDDIIDARRKGVITTETAIQMSAEIVEKIAGAAINFEKEAAKIVPFTAHKPGTPGFKTKMKPTKAKAQNPGIPGAIQPQAPAPIAKSEGPEITWTAEISKRDDEKRQVFGFALVTHINGEEVVDLQGDYTPLEEIEKAAYTYVIESRKGGDMHSRDGDQPLHTSDLVESFVVTPEKLEKMGLAPDAMPHGWWVGFKVNDDEQWEKVKSGERSGFSIHGSGRRVEKNLGV